MLVSTLTSIQAGILLRKILNLTLSGMCIMSENTGVASDKHVYIFKPCGWQH